MSSHLRSFGMISTSLWQSEKFQSIESLSARLAYIWLHTSQKTCAGILRIGSAHLFEEMDNVASLEEANAILQQLNDAGLIEWCKPYVIICKFLRFNPVKSYRHAIGAFNEVLALPDGGAKERLFATLKKQKGAYDLTAWRDKSGEPHKVIFAINDYLTGLEDKFAKLEDEAINMDFLSPSETPHEPLMTPSGKSRSKSINEKGESITPAFSEKPTQTPSIQHQEPNVEGLRKSGVNSKRPTIHATEAAKKSALATGAR